MCLWLACCELCDDTDRPMHTESTWVASQPSNVFVSNQTYPAGGMGETVMSQPSFMGGGMGGGMGETVMTSDSYGYGGGGLGTTVTTSSSDQFVRQY